KTRDSVEFAKFIGSLGNRYRRATSIHLVMDNLSTHTERSLAKHYGKDKARQLWSRLTVHYTPTHASWLNMAEIELGLLSRQALSNRRFENVEALCDQVTAWTRHANEARTKIRWRFTRKKARQVFGLKSTRTNRL